MREGYLMNGYGKRILVVEKMLIVEPSWRPSWSKKGMPCKRPVMV
jgi:hypothetical protein